MASGDDTGTTSTTGRLVRRGAAIRTALLLAALTAAGTGTAASDGVRWFGARGPTCPLGACLGPIACPGCGLCRSTVAALHGQFATAVAAHPAGPVLALLLLTGSALHLDILRRRRETALHARCRRAGHILFVIAVTAGWLFRLGTS